MNHQEKIFFDALYKDRAESAKILEKRSMQGIKASVVEKYSDQAHFIYELLQNADDAMATSARFILEKDRLIFAHNGTRHFSVSDPDNEDIDSNNGTLGDINAITSIANSNKTEASIGKFGVGFKAVFQYTSTPRIYDPNFRFMIDRFIVPVLLDEDMPERRPDETLFVFPFDHKERGAERAYEDISDKLKSLSFPLLFLSKLKNIEYEIEDLLGLYGKSVKQTNNFGDVFAEQICLTQTEGENFHDNNLWLFSRKDECERRYSVGFFLDMEGKLIPVKEPAYCFFPTKETTGLNFIVHAPFLLADSREGIRAGVEHNDNMLRLLAKLAADSLVCLKIIGDQASIRLINDDIVTVVPVNSQDFSDPSDKRKVSFKPFYTAIKEKLGNEELLPSTSGYASSENAYWAAVPQLPQLFSNSQLADITGNPNAHWVFASIGRDDTLRSNRPLMFYIDSLVRTNINEDNIISGRSRDYAYIHGVRQSLENVKGISAPFIEKQSIEWLHRFYKWIAATGHRIESAKNKPVFLNQNRQAVAAFDDEDQLILFLPVKDVTGYETVHPDLLEDPSTKKLIESIGIKQPSLRDQIYNIIIPQYRNDGDIDTRTHFKIFFRYFCKCSYDEVDEFIELIRDIDFIICIKDGKRYRTSASSLYMPTPELKNYFVFKPDIRFIDYDGYLELVGSGQQKKLDSFLSKLDVNNAPKIIVNRTDGYYERESESSIDGLKELIDAVTRLKKPSLSVFLWAQLCKFIESGLLSYVILNKSVMSRPDGRYKFRMNYAPSSTAIELKTSNWIVTRDNDFVSATNCNREMLSPEYETETEYAVRLMELLGIEVNNSDETFEDDKNLTDTQREKIAFADKMKEYGIENEDDLAEFQEFRRQKEAKKKATEMAAANMQKDSHASDSDSPDDFGDDEERDENPISEETRQPEKKATSNVIRDIVRRAKEKNAKSNQRINSDEDTYEIDQDELLPSTIDYSKKIEQAKEKSAAEINRITYLEELQNKAVNAPKYSYGWFNALLEIESINSGEANSNNKEVSISFLVVEREPGTKRTLVLKHPNRYIPQFMEDLADIPLVLHMGDQKKIVAIEVANIKSYTLRVKMKNSEDINGVDLSAVTLATIDAKSPVFLLEELRKEFAKLEYADDFDMQQNLCENIEFVFGPPGTGKTTHLAKNVLMPLMEEQGDCKVLVLTPTNKAADVLTRRIMEIADTDHTYEKWLVRFGATGDEVIEASTVFKDKTFDIRTLPKTVTVTTIARFPYDFFMPKGNRLFLNALKWDYIVIDEASMIPIANIVYPLYKKTPRKFIIAGDPFQIEPITSADLWKNENIYTMVKLDSFANPTTIPHPYKVELLTTQYRSIPDIGGVFSNFAYSGILKHYRSADSQRPLNLGMEWNVKTLNILKFPVSKYESIYRCKRLQHSSSYQVYSALFTFEYVVHLAKEPAACNPGSVFHIGVIAPYRAQADMIDKLLASEMLPKEIDVQVGTIHGFQGDECDIIFAVFNTPPTISGSRDMFLNKRNIINVSISRARDYMFIVMPDDQTENIDNLKLVKRVENLIKKTLSWEETDTPGLERFLFGDDKYLENNTFSTSHQSVNVYGLPERCYEVRTEDIAVDVQIHRGAQLLLGEKPGLVSDKSFSPKTPENSNHEFQGTFPDNQTTENVTGDVQEKTDAVSNKGNSMAAVPKGLQKSALEINVTGKRAGKYILVAYNGKLKNYTPKKTTGMFIPHIKNGKEKLISVSVIEEDKVIYIAKDQFKAAEKLFRDPKGIELRKTYFE